MPSKQLWMDVLVFVSCRDLGAHIDGFIAVAAHTIVVGASSDKKVTGKKADVILAAYWAVQAALRLIKDGASVSKYWKIMSCKILQEINNF